MSGAIKEAVTLKSLQSRLEKEKAELSVVDRQVGELRAKAKQHHQRIGAIVRQIKELTKDQLTMSEHAKLRFLERVELIPIDEIEKRVITEELIKMWQVLGNASYPIGIGEHTATVRDGVITTIK